nr:hypothetical protein Cduv_194 [Cedratvirus duvanny]
MNKPLLYTKTILSGYKVYSICKGGPSCGLYRFFLRLGNMERIKKDMYKVSWHKQLSSSHPELLH